MGADGALIEVLTEVTDHGELLGHSVEAAVVVERVSGAVAVADVVVVVAFVAVVAGEVAVVPVVAVVVVVQAVLVSVVTVGPVIENILKYFATRRCYVVSK